MFITVSEQLPLKENCPPVRVGFSVKVRISFRVRVWVRISFGIGEQFSFGAIVLEPFITFILKISLFVRDSKQYTWLALKISFGFFVIFCLAWLA